MAQPNDALVSVINPLFCAPDSLQLVIDKEPMAISDGKYAVRDVEGNFMFKVKRKSLCTIHDERVIIDAAGNHVVTLRQKLPSLHSRWEVYRGDSTSGRNDLVFTVKKSSAIQLETNLQVFLARNVAEEISDYRVKGSFSGGSCDIYAGESTKTTIAQMQKIPSLQSRFLGKDKFKVTVKPRIDNAFIVALIVILDEIKQW